MTPLEIPELAELLVRLERGVEETAAGFRRGALVVGLGFAAVAVLFAVRGAYGVAAIVLALGGGISWLGAVAARRSSPARAAGVLEALRAAPERVATIRHYVTSDSRNVFQSDWIEVTTADARLVVKALGDWEWLLATLSRRCPSASVTHGRQGGGR